MTIAWSGKRKRFHTIWVFEIYTTFIQKCIMPVYVVSSPKKVSTDGLDDSNAPYMK